MSNGTFLYVNVCLHIVMWYVFLIQIICIQFYGFKYSYQILIIHTYLYGSVCFSFFIEWHINLHRLFNDKTILEDAHQWYYWTHSRGKRQLIPFPNVLSKCRHNSETGVKTHLLRGCSPVLKSLCQGYPTPNLYGLK